MLESFSEEKKIFKALKKKVIGNNVGKWERDRSMIGRQSHIQRTALSRKGLKYRNPKWLCRYTFSRDVGRIECLIFLRYCSRNTVLTYDKHCPSLSTVNTLLFFPPPSSLSSLSVFGRKISTIYKTLKGVRREIVYIFLKCIFCSTFC